MALRDPDVRVTSLPRTPTARGIETASSTWHKGSFLVFTSGKVAIAGTNPRDICGVALTAASGTTDAEVIFARAIPGGIVQVEISLDKAGGLGTVPLAQTHVGGVYGVTKSAGGVWYLDIDKTTAGTNTVLVIDALVDPIGAATGDTPSDLNSGGARVLCSFLTEATYTGTAAS